MSVEGAEENQAAVSQESDVCVGDGTTCVECGKVFTHPFYFSTHISTHTNQRDFVVVGQCALCGLVFSDAEIFAAHLSSSQARMETQATPQDNSETAEEFADDNSELTSQNDPDLEKNSSGIKSECTDKQAIKGDSSMPQVSETATTGKDSTDEAVKSETRVKRKRKAPERFEVDSGPQFFPPTTDTDPEVEAYLLSLKEMGLTVDPAAFSSHKGGKRRRKGNESGFGKGKGKKEPMWTADAIGFPPDMHVQKKASPKYEYLDSDDSFEEEPEILPVSGKLTRGQRLQQRLERLSQSKEQGAATSTKKQSHAKDGTLVKDGPGTSVKDEPSINSAAVESEKVDKPKVTDVATKLKTNTAAVKVTKPPPGPGTLVKNEIKPMTASPAMRNLSRMPLTQNSGGRNTIHRTLPQPNLNKFNTVRAPVPHFVGKNSHIRAPALSNMNNSNMYQSHSIGNARTVGQKALRFPQGDVRGRKGDAVGFPGTLNVQKSSSLEDLKKNSRENVEQMLQSVGMIAVTSSAMIQGKFFSTQKEKCGEISFPPVRGMGVSGMHRPSFPQRGFPNRPFRTPETMPQHQALSYKGQSRFLSKEVSGRGQISSQAALVNSHYSPRGRQAPSPQTFKSGSTTGQFSYQQSVSHGRGAGGQRGRGQYQHNIRGAVKGSAAPLRGKVRPVTIPVQSSGSGRGRASSQQKQTKPGQGSSEIIVIDDDDILNVQDKSGGMEGTKNSGVGNKSRSKSSDTAQKSTSGHVSKGKVTILDVDLDSGVSNIKVIEDKTQRSPPASPLVEVEDKNNLAEHPEDDGNMDVECESEIDLSNSVKKREDSFKDEIHAANEDGPCTSKSAEGSPCTSKSAEGSPCTSKTAEGSVSCSATAAEDTDILPGEDIDGWKVCLAENSDSNDDASSPSNIKAASSKDQQLSHHGSPESGYSSAMKVEMPQKIPEQDQCNNQDLENDEQVHSESNVVLTHCVSAASEVADDRQSVCELQENAVYNDSADKACNKEHETYIEGAETRLDSIVSTSYSPAMNECVAVNPEHDWSSPNNRSSTEDVAGCDSIFSEKESESQPLSTIHVVETCTKVTADDADTPVQPDFKASTEFNNSPKCLNDKTTEDQEVLFNPDKSDSCSLSLTHNSAINSENVNTLFESDISVGDHTKKMETVTEESCVKFENSRKISDVQLSPGNGEIIKADSSLSSAANKNASDISEEANSLLSVSQNKALYTEKMDNGELHMELETHCSTPLIGCSNVPTVDNEEFVNGAVPSESSASQTSAAVPGSFLKDVNNLLDIFTEIEKTCKEMEEAQNVEKDDQAGLPSFEGDVKHMSSDTAENRKENMIKVRKVKESSNGMSSNEDIAKRDSSGDSKHIETYVKAVIDDKNDDKIIEDIEKVDDISY